MPLLLRRVGAYLIDCGAVGFACFIGRELLEVASYGHLLAASGGLGALLLETLMAVMYWGLLPSMTSTTIGISLLELECMSDAGGQARAWQWWVRMPLIVGLQGVAGVGQVVAPRDNDAPLPLASFDLPWLMLHFFALIALLLTRGGKGVHDIIALTTVVQTRRFDRGGQGRGTADPESPTRRPRGRRFPTQLLPDFTTRRPIARSGGSFRPLPGSLASSAHPPTARAPLVGSSPRASAHSATLPPKS